LNEINDIKLIINNLIAPNQRTDRQLTENLLEERQKTFNQRMKIISDDIINTNQRF
jgi:hypothetical protein